MQYVRSNKGFTLIEMLIALVVLSVGMLGFSKVSLTTINVNALNKRATTATALLQDRMESVKRSGYAGLKNASYAESYGAIQNYSAYKSVTSVSFNTPAANMKTVSVNIFWHQDKYSLSATTILVE